MLRNRQRRGLKLLNVWQLPLIQKQQLFYRIYFTPLKKQPIKLGFHCLQQLLLIRQNNLQVYQGRVLQIIKYLVRYLTKVVSIKPSHLLMIIIIKYYEPALYKASMFYGLVASSATV